MPFTTKSVLPVLPKPDHVIRSYQSRPLSVTEDKELRKKLRNRQSALAARERKKARMLELEKKVSELQQANKNLEEENSKLRHTLNTILRTAAVPDTRDMFSNQMNGTNCLITVSSGKSTGAIETSTMIQQGLSSSDAVLVRHGSGTDLATEQVCNGFAIVNQQNNYVEPIKLVTRASECNDSNPIDYSMHSNKHSVNVPTYSNTRDVNSLQKRLPIKSEERHIVRGLGHRQNDILNSFSKGGIKCNSAPHNAISVKREVNDISYCSHYQSNQHHTNSVVTKDDGDTMFARALKRSAQNMLMSKQTSSSSLINGNTVNLAMESPAKSLCKRKQALPSIDVVFSSPSNVHQNNAYTKAIGQLDNSLKSRTFLSDVQMSLFTPDLSSMIDNYSSSSNACDDDDILVGIYDTNGGTSPLESISSRDSGLGVDDDPLDWIPDTTFLDFQ